MKHFLEFITLLALIFFTGVAFASDTLESSWLKLIQADFDSSCSIKRIGVGNVISGNNGYRSEQWFLETCHGNMEYQVNYYPLDAFPERKKSYEVLRVCSKPHS